jgi:hypothetical protein
MRNRARTSSPASLVAVLAVLAALALAPLLASGALGCGGSAPPPAAPAAADDAPAPYPFTVAEIRIGCPTGRTLEYRVEPAGQPAHVERWTFTPVDDDTVKVTTAKFDPVGNPAGDPTSDTAKWAELHEHAHFMHAQTKIYNESITVPAGTFEVLKYVVTNGDEVKTLWFARSLPGPPVKMEVVKGGQTVLTWTMQANKMP